MIHGQRNIKNDIQVLATHASTWVLRYSSLLQRSIAAVKNIDAPMLTRVWQELEYRIDVCRVTRGALIEHL
jgi:phage FluMu protein gp41